MNDLDKIFMAVLFVPLLLWLTTFMLLWRNLDSKIQKILEKLDEDS